MLLLPLSWGLQPSGVYSPEPSQWWLILCPFHNFYLLYGRMVSLAMGWIMNKGLLGVSGASVSPESLVGKSVPQWLPEVTFCNRGASWAGDALVKAICVRHPKNFMVRSSGCLTLGSFGSILLLHSAREEFTTKYFGFSIWVWHPAPFGCLGKCPFMSCWGLIKSNLSHSTSWIPMQQSSPCP